METLRYTPIPEENMKTYIFQAEIEQDDDGRWSEWIEALPGCAVWGYTKEEALAGKWLRRERADAAYSPNGSLKSPKKRRRPWIFEGGMA